MTALSNLEKKKTIGCLLKQDDVAGFNKYSELYKPG